MTDIKQQDLTLRRSLFRFNNLSFVIMRAGLNKRNSINQRNKRNQTNQKNQRNQIN
jgi:hypothetical protein